MKAFLLRNLVFVLAITACSSPKHNSKYEELNSDPFLNDQPELDASEQPLSLMDLPQSEYGGFVLKQGFYETEFKTYCLQPGTPDPRQGDAYLHTNISGYRKDIIEAILTGSAEQRSIEQKNIQLLLWAVVSGSDFNKLPYTVREDAARLLTPKQIFELKGGVVGMIKNVSSATGLLNANSDMKRLFETGISTYESFEKIAVLQQQSVVTKKGMKPDQWYREKENYYVRYYPENYKRIRIQVYVPEGILDADNKLHGEYVVFDPTGKQAVPLFTNAQRLGIGSPVLDIVREMIKINRPQPLPDKRKPRPREGPET